MSNRTTTALAAVILVGLCASSQAAAIFVEGGSLQCGQWLANRKDQSSLLYESFAIGLLGGMAMGHDKEFWHAGGETLSRDAAFSWIDAYCRDHSSDTVTQAAMTLFRERTGAKVLHSEYCADSHLTGEAGQACIKRDAPRP